MGMFNRKPSPPGPVPGDTSRQLAELQAGIDQLLAESRAARDEAEHEAPAARTLSPDDWSEINQVLFRRLQLPWIEDLLLLFDRLAEADRGSGEASAEDLRGTLTVLKREVLEILANQGIEQVERYGPYDRRLHRVTSVLEVSDEALDDRISQIIRDGFSRQGTVIRKAEVVITKVRRAGEVSP